jgi:hypothetical protein
VHGAVGEDFVERAGDFGLGIFGEEGFDFLGVRIVNPFERGAGFEEAVALAVDVPVVEVRGGKREFTGFDYGTGFALGGVGHAVGFLAHGGDIFEKRKTLKGQTRAN